MTPASMLAAPDTVYAGPFLFPNSIDSCHNCRVSGEDGFRGRAGALLLLLALSVADRETTLAILAEMTTGVSIELDVSKFAEDEMHMAVFEDDYLLEPAEPGEIDVNTKFRATEAGGEFLFVATVITSWLRLRPAGPIDLDEEAVQPMLALIAGWASGTLHELAAEPLTVAEASERMQTLAPDAVQARIEAMAVEGLVEEVTEDEDDEPRYAVADWGRRGIAPILAGARMELRYPPGGTAPIAVADVEAAFRLALPLLRLPAEASGSCALAVGLEPEVADEPVGVTVRVEQGRVLSVEPGVDGSADTLASGSAAEWLDTMTEANVDRVETSDDSDLAGPLVDELHETLFGQPLRAISGGRWGGL
jgi:hypothetical protein